MKTRKLKKVWNKLQQAQAECRDLEVEFQRERTDMLDTIRELTRQLKLKSLVISNFIPMEDLNLINRRATWDEEADDWVLPRPELCGNNNPRQVRRPGSASGLRRPETDYARHRKQYDTNPR